MALLRVRKGHLSLHLVEVMSQQALRLRVIFITANFLSVYPGTRSYWSLWYCDYVVVRGRRRRRPRTPRGPLTPRSYATCALPREMTAT